MPVQLLTLGRNFNLFLRGSHPEHSHLSLWSYIFREACNRRQGPSSDNLPPPQDRPSSFSQCQQFPTLLSYSPLITMTEMHTQLCLLGTGKTCPSQGWSATACHEYLLFHRVEPHKVTYVWTHLRSTVSFFCWGVVWYQSICQGQKLMSTVSE